MFETLNEFDRQVAQAVGEAFPNWIGLAKAEESNGERAFVLEVEPPSHNLSYPLRIETFGGEVTVLFEYYHSHFDDFCDGSNKDALTLVRTLVSSDHAVVSYWRDDQWCCSMLVKENEIPMSNDEHPYADRIRVRSWSGALDKDISCIPRG